MFRFALGCAERAKDWPLRAGVLDTMAMQEIRTGHPDEALTLTELALVRADDRLTATVQTMLHATRARSLAKMRRVNDTLTAIGAAEELRELARYAAPHQHLDEVAHLRHRINTLLVGTDSP